MSNNSLSFFSKSRGDMSLSLSPTNDMSKFGTTSGTDFSLKQTDRPRMTLSTMGKSNTLSVFEATKRPLDSKTLALTQSSHRMSIVNVRVVSDDTGLPKNFDVEKVKSRWIDSKTCQL